MKTPHSWPKHFPKAPLPNTIIFLCRLGFHITVLRGHKHSDCITGSDSLLIAILKWMYDKFLEQCLAHEQCYISICYFHYYVVISARFWLVVSLNITQRKSTVLFWEIGSANPPPIWDLWQTLLINRSSLLCKFKVALQTSSYPPRQPVSSSRIGTHDKTFAITA